ncbi:MAG: hypothetical protein NC483_02580 [Ruminococcus sp.]|nr:hypothetical protein [Ruminococcus sp.]
MVLKIDLRYSTGCSVTGTKEITNPEFLRLMNKEENISEKIIDNEINELVVRIKEKCSLLEGTTKDLTLKELDTLLANYEMGLKKLKPIFDNDSLSLTLYDTPASLRAKLLSDLIKLDNSFYNLDMLLELKQKISTYKSYLNGELINNMPTDIVEIKKIADFISGNNFIAKFMEMLAGIEAKLIIPNNEILSLNSITKIEKELTTKIHEFYETVLYVYVFYLTLNCETGYSLSQDISTLKIIINALDTNNKNIYNKRLKELIAKYQNKIKVLDLSVDFELAFRNELDFILKDLALLVPNVMGKKNLLEDISVAKNIIAQNGEANSTLNVISIATKELLKLLNNPILVLEIKKEVLTSLLDILNKAYSSLLDNTYFLEERNEFECLDLNTRIALQILGDVYGLKFKVESYIANLNTYNSNIEVLNLRRTTT